MTDITWVIPPSTLTWLDTVPSDRPVAMLVRHSVRGHLPPGDAGYALPITDVGHQLARELGMKLRGRLRRVHASPLLRTMQTAERLAEGAEGETTIVPDRMLGDPGAFVVDGRAGATWSELGHEEVMRRLVHGDDVLPGHDRVGLAWAAVEAEATREQAMQALRESEARFAAMFETSPVGMALGLMDNGRFLDVNRA